jgi:hypothetical protein
VRVATYVAFILLDREPVSMYVCLLYMMKKCTFVYPVYMYMGVCMP